LRLPVGLGEPLALVSPASADVVFVATVVLDLVAGVFILGSSDMRAARRSRASATAARTGSTEIDAIALFWPQGPK
jgi:hypothetical protein